MYRPRKKSFFSKLFDTVRLQDNDDEVVDEEYNVHEYDPEAEGGFVEDEDDEPSKAEIHPEDLEGELGIDMYETHNAVVIRAITAGVKLSDIDINITREHVSIRGTRTQSHRIDPEDFVTQEIYWGAFSREVALPCEVDIDEVEAIEDHGLLTVTMPKLNKNRRTVVKVRSI
jgi:HSP20 family protein